MKKLIYVILSAILACSCLLFVGCEFSWSRAEKMPYTEWSDESGKISFRMIKGVSGHGVIKLNGKDVVADFVLGIQNYIHVGVLSEDIDYDYNYTGSDGLFGVWEDSFHAYDVNKKGQIVSFDEDVVLFGEHFGRIVLTPTPIDINTVDAWEYYNNWVNDDSDVFICGGSIYGYAPRKYAYMSVYTDSKSEHYFFQWIPEEKGFAIYPYNNTDLIEEGAEVLASGTYTNVGEHLTLTFTEDNIFDGRFTVLELYVMRS